MSAYAPHVWDQLRNLSSDDLIAALKKDGWDEDGKSGAVFAYKKGANRVTIHYHSGKTYGPKLLKGLLEDIGWSEKDMRKLKLVK